MRKDQEAIAGERYIRNLIAEGEHQKLDFKFAVNDSRKIARSLVAFGNTEGGKLLLGVKDNGAIAGVRSEEEYFMLEAAAQLYCKPEIPIKAKNWLVEGKTVLEVDIPKMKAPCFVKDENNQWRAYVRVADQNILANRVLLEFWKRKKVPKGTFVEYSKAENELLNYLSSHSTISLSAFTKVAHITHTEAEDILVNLMSLGIIEIHLHEKGASYSLKEVHS